MTTLSKLAALTLAISTVFASTNVLADNSASGTVSITSYQLIDLDPTDGITAAITFNGGFNESYTVGGLDRYSRSFNEYRRTFDLNPVSSSMNPAGVTAGSNSPGGLFGSVESHGSISNDGNFQSYQVTDTDFTITPKTLLVLIGHTTGQRTENAAGAGIVENVSDWNQFSLSGHLLADGFGSQVSSGAAFLGYGYGGPNYSRNFALSFSNLGTEALNGSYWARTEVTGLSVGRNSPPYTPPSTTPTPVPEPETYALMLAGLSMLGLMARRRKA